MDSYVVVFETESNEPQFRAYLKTLSNWGRITENAYVVRTTKSATQIRDELTSISSPGDRIAVIKSGYVGAWRNARANDDWLKKNL